MWLGKPKLEQIQKKKAVELWKKNVISKNDCMRDRGLIGDSILQFAWKPVTLACTRNDNRHRDVQTVIKNVLPAQTSCSTWRVRNFPLPSACHKEHIYIFLSQSFLNPCVPIKDIFLSKTPELWKLEKLFPRTTKLLVHFMNKHCSACLERSAW